jgi:dedicator of cytokinesis protein 3
VNKLQETYASPAVQDNEEVRAQEEENIEYCLTLLPK